MTTFFLSGVNNPQKTILEILQELLKMQINNIDLFMADSSGDTSTMEIALKFILSAEQQQIIFLEKKWYGIQDIVETVKERIGRDEIVVIIGKNYMEIANFLKGGAVFPMSVQYPDWMTITK